MLSWQRSVVCSCISNPDKICYLPNDSNDSDSWFSTVLWWLVLAWWAQQERFAHACRVTILPSSWRCSGVVPMTGVLGWKNTDSFGRTSRGVKAEVSPSVSVTSWSAQFSPWEWMRRWQRSYGSALKGGQRQVTIKVEVCYSLTRQTE